MPEVVGRLRTPRLASAPATPQVGEMYYDTTTNVLYWWNGTAWTSAAGGGGVPAVDNVVSFSYNLSASLISAGPPAAGEIRFDNSNIRNASAMNLSWQDTRGVDLMNVFTVNTTNAYYIIVTPTTWIIFRLASDGSLTGGSPGWTSYNVTFIAQGPTIPPAGPVTFGVFHDNTIPSTGGQTGKFLGVVSNGAPPSWMAVPGVLPVGGSTGQVLAKSSATNYATQWQAPLDLRYNGAWVAGTYTDGDVAIYNGVAYMAVKTTAAAPVPWVPSPSQTTYGTTLPASPVDGQEAILVDSVTAPTWRWRFRYNAQSTGTYKWEFVGGAPMFMHPAGSLGVFSANVWTTMIGGLSVPRSGVYQVYCGCAVQNAVAGAPYNTYTRALFSTAGTSYQAMFVLGSGNTPYGGVEVAGQSRMTLAAGETSVIQGNIGAAQQTNFTSGWMRLLPEAVA